MDIRTAAAAVLAGLAAGCGARGDDGSVARLTATTRAQEQRIEELSRRLNEVEARSRSLEEQIAAVRAREGRAAPAAAAPETPAPRADEGLPPDDGSPGSVAALLETPEGRERMRAFLEEEKKREETKQREERREQMKRMITERVQGSLARELNLTESQQSTVITVFTDTMDRMGEIWREARDGGDPNALAAVRDRMGEIRRDAETTLQQALTVDQFEKLQEMTGPGGNFMGGFGGRGGDRGFGGPRGGSRGGDGGR